MIAALEKTTENMINQAAEVYKAAENEKNKFEAKLAQLQTEIKDKDEAIENLKKYFYIH